MRDKIEEKTFDKEKYIMTSVDTSLSILNLYFENEELSATEVGKLIGISRSAAFRFLVTLENQGFLSKTENSRYRLGVKVFNLGQLVYTRMELISYLHPYLARIALKTGETANLAIMDDATHIAFMDKALGSNWLKMDTPLGFRHYAHLTATGKAILAYESDRFINQYIRSVTFEKRTEESIGSVKELLEVLQEIRENGYSNDNEECEVGLTCYAVPIFDRVGRPIAAISSSGPTSRMTSEKESHIALLQEVVERVSGAEH